MKNNISKVDNNLFKEVNPYKVKQRTPKKVLDRNDFMLLFVKQLQYQDPMHPLENNEMATQLALFNQLDELYSLNQKFDQLIELSKDNTFYNYALLVGKLVDVEGNESLVKQGQFLGAKIKIEEPISDLKIKIISKNSGRTVKTIDLGALSPGEYPISWDAKDEKGNQVDDGVYLLSLETNGDQEFLGKLIVTGEITSISFNNDKVTFTFNGIREIESKEIKSIKDFSQIFSQKENNDER